MEKEDLRDAIAYCRVSTEKQVDTGHALERYIESFLRFGFTEDQIYYDIGSGGRDDRKGYQAALERVKQGAKRVFVPELTRFSRSVRGFEDAIDLFQSYGAKLVTLDGHNFDLSSPTGLTNTRIMMAFAEQERLIKKHHAIAGLEKRRKDGKPMRTIFGYTMGKDRLIPNQSLYKKTDKTYWDVAQELVATFLECQSLRKTSLLMCDRYGDDKLNGHGMDFPRNIKGIKYWLSSETIRGNIQYFPREENSYVVYGTHEPLISPSISRDINGILKVITKSKRFPDKAINPFVEIAYCHCGSKMISRNSRPNGSAYNYLVCKRNCDRSSFGLTVSKLEAIVISRLKERIDEIADFYFSEDDLIVDPRLAKIESEIAKIESLSQEIEELKPVLIKKLQERDAILAASVIAEKQYQSALREKFIEYAKDDDFWESATVLEKRSLFGELIDRIDCCQGVPAISFSF